MIEKRTEKEEKGKKERWRKEEENVEGEESKSSKLIDFIILKN